MERIGSDQVLLFGGESYGTISDETWIYDLGDNMWTQMNPSMSPVERWEHQIAMVGSDRVLLFGGTDANQNYLNDTYIYDLSDNTWNLQTPTTTPSERFEHGMASIGEGIVVMFGGLNNNMNDETWVYTATNPNNPPLFVLPSPECGTTFTVDVGSQINFSVAGEDVDAGGGQAAGQKG